MTVLNRIASRSRGLMMKARATLRKPQMPYVFMSTGGCGSSYVTRRLRSSRIDVAERPDAALTKFSYEELDGPPQPDAIARFDERTRGFRLAPEGSIEESVLEYVGLLQADEGKTALFSNVAQFGFFSRNRIRNVVLLTRHPMQAYLSFAKPVRHRDIIDHWGGLYSESSLRQYADYWVAFVREYLALREVGCDPGLLRYEDLRTDSVPLGLDKCFFDFRPGINDCADERAPEIMYSLVAKEFHEIYPHWDIRRLFP